MSRRILPLAAILLTALPALAQSHRASVRGVVADPTGAPVQQVAVRVTSETTGESRAAVTEADGRFAVPMLPPGDYRIEVERPGFKKYV